MILQNVKEFKELIDKEFDADLTLFQIEPSKYLYNKRLLGEMYLKNEYYKNQDVGELKYL